MENKTTTVAIIIGIVVAGCCICGLVVCMLGYGFYIYNQTFHVTENIFSTPTSVPQMRRVSVDSISNETLQTLQQNPVPENDPYELACRLKGLCNVPKIVETRPYQAGDTEKFWIMNSDTEKHHQINATLLYITDHTYFWAENGVKVNKDDMKALMDTFENKIYPTDRQFFGSEWTPGVDGDPHIFVIYAKKIGNNIAGYFNSSDELNPLIKKYSNGHEIYVLGASQNLASEYTYTTLAHEFVHMIQFPSDRNDAAWLSEGFAEVGAFINGYTVGYADFSYIQNPDLQLNDWVNSSSPGFSQHYGESFLFFTYFLDRFGEEATKALTANPENDLASVDDTLKQLDITDPVMGNPVTADSFFMDWAVTNILLDPSFGDGRYVYKNYPGANRASATETILTCLKSPQTYDVHQ